MKDLSYGSKCYKKTAYFVYYEKDTRLVRLIVSLSNTVSRKEK